MTEMPALIVLGFAAILARIALAAIFLFAAVTKFFDVRRTAEMLRNFGVPQAATGVAARILPSLELAIGAALLPSTSARFAAMAALAVLFVFSIAVATNVALGRRPDCRCFGQTAAAPIGWMTVVRNSLFIAIAALIIASPVQRDSAVIAWLGERAGWAVLMFMLLAFVSLQAFLMLQMLRQQGRMLLRLEQIAVTSGGQAVLHEGTRARSNGVAVTPGLGIGTIAPRFRLQDLSGEHLGLDDFLALGRRVAILFAHPSCGPCASLVPQIAQWDRELFERLTVVVISEGNKEQNRKLFASHGIRNVLLQSDRATSNAYQAYGTPSLIIVDVDGRIGSGVAAGSDAIRELVESAAVGPRAAEFARPAPAFAGQTTDGRTIASADFVGRDFVLLFWSPDCGFCAAMVGALLEWDRTTEASLIVVSSRHDEGLTSGGLRSLVLIDDRRKIAQAFGVGGTPMAVRIGADGMFVSNIVPGKDAVLRLLDELAGHELGAGSLTAAGTR